MICFGSVPFCNSRNTSIWFAFVWSTPAWHAATPMPGTTTACTPIRNASLLLTHVAEAMTSRLLERSTAMIDQVAEATLGSRHATINVKAKRILRMPRIMHHFNRPEEFERD